MRKIINSTLVSLDGVISDPHLWSMKYFDLDESGPVAMDLLFSCDALIMGRETYVGFAEAWPERAGQGDPFADRMSEMAKYVVSDSLEKAEWNNTTIVPRAEFPAVVAELKKQEGLNILQYGFGAVTQALMADGLVDEVKLWLHPVIVGDGTRLGEAGFTAEFTPVESRQLKTGVTITTYKPAE
jgi:dihydrofolate reductase